MLSESLLKEVDKVINRELVFLNLPLLTPEEIKELVVYLDTRKIDYDLKDLTESYMLILTKYQGVCYSNYFANNKRSIGVKIAVCRYLQKWMVKGRDYDIHLSNLGPLDDLRNNFKNGKLTADEFYNEYLMYLKTRQEDLAVIKSYLDEGIDVTLLCYEKDICHRHVICSAFKLNYYCVEEVKHD